MVIQIIHAVMVCLSVLSFPLATLCQDLHPFSHISDMKNWIHKYSFDQVSGVTAFTIKEFSDRVLKTLGKRKYAELLKIERIGPQTPILEYRNFLHFGICEPHNCGFHEFHFFIETTKSKVFICEQKMFFTHLQIDTSPKIQITWYGLKKSIDIHDRHCLIQDDKTGEIRWKETLSLIPYEINR